ncbi:amino acid ABC transporter substrate-binding protein [Xanthobacter dioxanivorans]|uniref:Amino acid ABC transporter substrate-binding protein n=1 Tax=Xanthobacter dioxanivorans TaxID=2528964 RepID=A0A974PMB9_9HYPH|nr:amino acid ABC transporter substrate-binding protein [Xanthobacter dioxanivorans]QRG05958.1 amino acid ABC transporter substrate-binding protein [Xanthobacter dioxanivorans]
MRGVEGGMAGRERGGRARCRGVGTAALAPLVAALLLALGQPAGAQTLDRVARGEAFRIGYRHFAPPYSYAAANGQAAGYIVDLCREVADGVKRALKLPSLPIEYLKVTAEDRFEAVRDGRIDVLCEPTSMTMSRRALVDFSLPTFIDGAGVVTRGAPVKGLEDLKGKKVGVLKGTTTEETLRSTLNQMRIAADVVTVTDHPDGLRQLADGKLDAYFGDRGILNYLISNSLNGRGLTLSDQYFTFETYALALPRGDQAFRLLVDSTLADLYRTERIREIYARSFGKFPPDQFLNALFVINGVPK